MPSVKQNRFSVVIDPGRGSDPGAIGIGGTRSDVVLEVSKIIKKLLSDKVNVSLTRENKIG